ncbi:MAG: polyprenyl synthetase family protein [Culicoidibacterales bacterium]
MMKRDIEKFEAYMKQRFAVLEAPKELKEAMSYSLFSGGKRIRPLMVMATASLKPQVNKEIIFPLAMAIEMVHTYSLIHDDLPAMDNDDLRRGKPSNHKVFGEALAILAGDGLLSQSFEILMETETSIENIKKIVTYFSQCAGINGMVGGQVMDMRLDIKHQYEATLADIQVVHHKKTGKLIELSVVAAAQMMAFSKKELEIIEHFSHIVGMMFQAVDDFQDDDITTGKTQNIDVINGKITYVSLLGKDNTAVTIKAMYQNGMSLLEQLEKYDTAGLKAILDLIVKKIK